MKKIECIHCHSTHVWKHGYQSGVRRYLCVTCGRSFGGKNYPGTRAVSGLGSD